MWQECGDYDIQFCVNHNNFPSAMELFTAPSLAAASTASFSQGLAQNLARWPNVDMHGRSATPGSPYKPWANASSPASEYQGGVYADVGPARGFRLGGGVLPRKIAAWNASISMDVRQAGNTPWVHIGQQWMDAHCELAGFGGGKGDNSSSATVWAAPGVCTGRSSSLDSSEWGDGSRYYLYNLIAELDHEGEYFTDTKAGMVYWIPPKPSAGAGRASSAAQDANTTGTGTGDTSPVAYASMLRTAVTIINATDVVLQGVAVLHARGNGVEVLHSSNVTLRDAVIGNHGGLGVNITNSSNATIDGCTISGTGDGGVWLEGGNRSSLAPSNLVLSNSTLHGYNRWDRTYRPGVTLVGAGAVVRGSLFHDSPHQCIMVVGNDHLVADNRFQNNLFESSDSGVVYAETDLTFLGNVISGNNFTGIHSAYYPRMNYAKAAHPRSGGWWGDWVKAIHLDNQVGGFLVEKNYFSNYSYIFDINGGGQHVIQGNTFGPCPNASCTAVLSLHADGSGGYSLPCPRLPGNGTDLDYIRKFDFNRVKDSWNSTVWRQRYPAFAAMMANELYCIPWRNVVADNIYVDVPCDVYPLSHDRAPASDLKLWNFTARNNSNTLTCGDFVNDPNE